MMAFNATLLARSAATARKAAAGVLELMSGTADTRWFAGTHIVLSDIEPVQNSVPDVAGVSVTSIVVLVTP